MKQISPKQRLKILLGKQLTKEDHKVYLEIWREREHKCIVSGQWLPREPQSTYFHHILPKEENKFPQYRHEKWNIVIVSPTVHDQIEKGVKIPPLIEKLYLEALEKHRSFAENKENE